MENKCPQCIDGYITCVACDGASLKHIEIRCEVCNGSGKIDDVIQRRLVDGQKKKDGRIARGLTLRKEAERLGMDPVELSKQERGIV